MCRNLTSEVGTKREREREKPQKYKEKRVAEGITSLSSWLSMLEKFEEPSKEIESG